LITILLYYTLNFSHIEAWRTVKYYVTNEITHRLFNTNTDNILLLPLHNSNLITKSTRGCTAGFSIRFSDNSEAAFFWSPSKTVLPQTYDVKPLYRGIKGAGLHFGGTAPKAHIASMQPFFPLANRNRYDVSSNILRAHLAGWINDGS